MTSMFGGLSTLLGHIPVVGGVLTKVVSGVEATVAANTTSGAPAGPAGVAIAVVSPSPTGDTFLDSLVRKVLIIGVGLAVKMLKIPGPIATIITNMLVPAALLIEHELTHHKDAVATAVSAA
jgi:hypothetical protein